MTTTLANRNAAARVRFIAFLTVALTALLLARSQDAPHAREIIPLIQMDNVPLKEVIKNLARQTGQNYILDPRLCCPWVGPDGGSARGPSVTFRWENLTAEQALARLLQEHGLTMVANPATSIARITFTNQSVKPLPATAAGDGTNAIIPLIVMDSVPLADAIKNLARQLQPQLAVDPVLPVPASAPLRRIFSDCAVSVRWANVSARQALVALLDNYDLVLVPDPANASATIKEKARTESDKSPKER